MPDIPISITESQSPVALRSYMLTCQVSPPSTLSVTSPSYHWSRSGQDLTDQRSRVLDLSPLSRDNNNAMYTCRYTASSNYVNSVDVSASHTVILTSKFNSDII